MISVWLAYAVDLLLGDPRWIPHPVVMIGHLISRLERGLRFLFRAPLLQTEPNRREEAGTANPSQQTVGQNRRERLAGILLVLLTVGTSGGMVGGLLWLAAQASFWLAFALNIWLIAATIAIKGLAQAGRRIYDSLEQNHIEQAREQTGQIVGRDTQHLTEAEITRAAVESVAENIVDAVISPLFYAMIGGAPLAMMYRAANTLDSMVGYKNDRYRYFGWASARFDDLLNWIPARIAGMLIILTAFLFGYSGQGAWRAIRRDAAKHPSPNSGIPEAAVAGALGVRLGGFNTYQGVETFRAYMGEPLQSLSRIHIRQVIRILHISSFLMLIGGSLVWALLQSIVHH
ncbi:adenosylcobinamide-phosphate synthase CbiB [Effusibacillus dendaii]|uniref:Cobalamin biosynthesis protein CobD n=1 Tax=Effusibacillus dendaii TaxID=2743772 RepID=A0A7I8DFE0_9BACL|nr:adenosylcobinamide-phosphate synthase CbiB [Effusibacillus dendaii]BCJ86631.1 cobalamin biosynthesis protein CobD [Effusibacillus dendaii]